jgi:ABC-type hemin transport system ATPase subunit
LHDLNLAAQYADHVVLMKAGKVVAQGDVDETMVEPVLGACFSTTIRRMQHPETGRPLLYTSDRERARPG